MTVMIITSNTYNSCVAHATSPPLEKKLEEYSKEQSTIISRQEEKQLRQTARNRMITLRETERLSNLFHEATGGMSGTLRPAGCWRTIGNLNRLRWASGQETQLMPVATDRAAGYCNQQRPIRQ